MDNDKSYRFRGVEDLTSAENRELIQPRRKPRVLGMENELLKRVSAYIRKGEDPPEIGFRFVYEMAARSFPVAITCRVVSVSRSGSIAGWGGTLRPVTARCRDPRGHPVVA